MAPPGYLHHWIQKYYKRVWPQRTSPPRIMGKRAVSLWEMDNFLKFGKALVSRLNETIPEDRRLPIEFEILDLEDDGAWVVWPAHCYCVLFTKALVWKIQRICWQASEVMRTGMTVPVKSSNFLSQLWGNLPKNEAHFYHFGSLISHIAFSFIVHHELAHAGLGHEALATTRGTAPGFLEAETDLDAVWGLWDEFAAAADTAPQLGDFLIKQALETDADVHGMFYTRRLLLDEAEKFRSKPDYDNDIMGSVWKLLLRDSNCEQLMLFIGVTVGLLALLPNLEAGRVDESIKDRSHPPLPSRVLLVLHVAGWLSEYSPSFWENRSAAITTAIILINSFHREEYGRGIERREINNTKPNGDESDGSASENPVVEKWRSLSHISIVDAWLRQDELGSYWETIVSQMRIISPKLIPYARFPEYLCYQWYRPANLKSLEN